MARRYKFGSARRDRIWFRERNNAALEGRGNFPICNLCDTPVEEHGWHESHCPGRAKAFGGKRTAVAHAACNLKHGAQVVTPMVAKANAQRLKHEGRKGPGRGRHPMRAGRRSGETKTFKRGLQRRTTLSEKLAAMRAMRAIVKDHAGGASQSVRPHPAGAGGNPVPRSISPEATCGH